MAARLSVIYSIQCQRYTRVIADSAATVTETAVDINGERIETQPRFLSLHSKQQRGDESICW
jgi:hypothetical protein